jgi:UDP-GlcNAc:polypeptide alpha-N-acetylglucosaminyltransferase
MITSSSFYLLLSLTSTLTILIFFSSFSTTTFIHATSSSEGHHHSSSKIHNNNNKRQALLLSAENAPENKFKLRGTRKHFRSAIRPWINSFDESFYIAIAAFRDVECVLTIRDMMKKASNPRRLVLGILEQNEHGDPTCIPDEWYDCNSADFCPMDNVRRRITVSRKGRGPCFGRYVSFLMYRGEAYSMMMDSHNMFIKHWDAKSIIQLHRARSSRPVISHYPNSWIKDGTGYDSPGNRIVMCSAHYMPMGYVRMDGRWVNRAIEPVVQPYSAGGYLFGDAILIHDVPFDPYLDFLFDGEEILYSARMFTHGFDMMTPGEAMLYHDYNRHAGVRYWTIQNAIPNNHGWHQEVVVSQNRAQLMMEIPKENTTRDELLVDPSIQIVRVKKEFAKYTIGKRRSMKEYNWFAKVDAVHRKTSQAFCDELEGHVIRKSGK